MTLRRLDKTPPVLGVAEYIWIDKGLTLRSKTRIIEVDVGPDGPVPRLLWWAFDGSSTAQAEGDASDCILQPSQYVTDPFRGGETFLVLCEVRNDDGSNHATNHRAKLRA